MAGPANDTSYLPLLRELWPDTSIEFCLYEEDPWLGSIRKDTNFTEKVRHVGTGYSAGGGGVSTRFASAKQYKSPSKTKDFQVSLVSYYALLSVDGQLARRAKHGKNKAIVVDPLMTESQLKMEEVRKRLARDIHRGGTGAIGRISSAGNAPASSATITLTNAADVRNFELDMPIQLSSTNGGGTVRAGVCIVTAISEDEASPTITVAGTTFADSITAPGTSDYIFPVDAYDNVVYGADSWCPTWSSGSLPGTFALVDRNAAPAKLAGRIVDAATLGITSKRDALLRGARVTKDAGGKPKQAMLSTRNWESLAAEIQSAGKVTYTAVAAQGTPKFKPGLEYKAIELISCDGPMAVMACPDMPDAYARVIDPKDWYLGSCGPLISWQDGAKPGAGMMEENADAQEYRAVGDIQLVCQNPGRQTKILF